MARRHDLDWLRVMLFGLLVPYHAAIGFVGYGHTIYGYRNHEAAGVDSVYFRTVRVVLLSIRSGSTVAPVLIGLKPRSVD
jgi:hypothetical protein